MRRPRKRGEPPDRRWDPAEDRTIIMATGAFGLDYIARNVHRTPAAVYARIRHLLGGGGVGRGTLSLNRVAEETGYDRRQIQRAGRALGQRWQRTSTTGRIMLSDDQKEALVRWLARDYWCGRSHLYACVYCGRDDRPPHGLGLCRLCYQALRKRFRVSSVEMTKAGLLRFIAQVKARTPDAERDWLLAFEASLETSGVVLTRGTIERLLEAARGLGGNREGAHDGSSVREA